MNTATAAPADDGFGDDFFNQTADTSNTTAEQAHEGGNFVSAEGRFHFLIESVELVALDKEKFILPHAKLKMRVLNGTADSEIQKLLTHRLYLAKWIDSKDKKQGPEKLGEKSLLGVVVFLHSFGVAGEDAFGGNFLITRDVLNRLADTQGIAKVTKDKDWQRTKDGKTEVMPGGYKIAWNTDTWPLGHEKVQDVPIDREAASIAGIDTGGGVSEDDLADI